jgi:hypothetical protein
MALLEATMRRKHLTLSIADDRSLLADAVL